MSIFVYLFLCLVVLGYVKFSNKVKVGWCLDICKFLISDVGFVWGIECVFGEIRVI